MAPDRNFSRLADGPLPYLVVQFRRMIPEIDRRLRLDLRQGSLRATINEGTKRRVHTTSPEPDGRHG